MTDRFEMGRVVSRAFGTISRNIGLFLGLAVLLVMVPGLVVRLLVGVPTVDPATGFTMQTGLFLLATTLLSFFLNYVLMAALSYATVADMSDERPTFGKALGVGLRYGVPLFLLAVVSLFGIYFGLIFFLVPGLILLTMWSVSAPAMVTERLGVFASLGRSRSLTKGSRWAIFGLLLVAGIIALVPLMIVPVLSGALTDPVAAAADGIGLDDIIGGLLGSATIMVLIAIVAAIYVELRAIKEGASVESLASIFA
jgi:hypothetical protein